MRDRVQRAGWALLAALETMHATRSKRPDWLIDLWRLYYRKGWPNDGETAANEQATTLRREQPTSDHRSGRRRDLSGVR